jgi:hypothetical protein
MILDGTQPTLTQVPPIVPRSMSVTRAPCSAAFSAAAIAPPPPRVRVFLEFLEFLAKQRGS